MRFGHRWILVGVAAIALVATVAALPSSAADGAPERWLVVHERSADPARVEAAFASLGLPSMTLDETGVSVVRGTEAEVEPIAGEPWAMAAHPDRPLANHLDEAAPLVNAPPVWNEVGYSGTNATVFVLDSGIDSTHPDLRDRVVENAGPADLGLGLTEAYLEDQVSNDGSGHGTHVAGIVAGTGQALGEADPTSGTYVGVAPGAEIVGFSRSSLLTSHAVMGFEYALENAERLGIDVITNSYGGPGEPDPTAPLSVASLEAYKAGMSVVFSGGNSGAEPLVSFTEDLEVELNRHGMLPWTISVPAYTSEAELADVSSQGTDPRESGRIWEHTDVGAQGEAVMSPKARTGWYSHFPTRIEPDDDVAAQSTHYVRSTGTSMSAPAIAGVLALMYDANPDLSPAQAYDILVETARQGPEERPYWEAGVGIADAQAAVTAAESTEGRIDAFLSTSEDELPYTNLSDPLDDPTRSWLIDHADEREDARALAQALNLSTANTAEEAAQPTAEEASPGTADEADAGEEGSDGADTEPSSIPTVGSGVLVVGVLAALLGRRPPPPPQV